jgi:hypothetical protein
MDDSDTIRTRCPYRDQCLPPGECKRSNQRPMQEAKDEACGKPRACSLPRAPRDPQKVEDSEKINCGQIEDLISNGQRCIDRRVDLMRRCFRGGDSKHEDEVAKVDRNVNECKAALSFAKSQNLCK